uniref:Uncharacterized protein n=1 Tax=Pristionchus pacificus TaxID=54126 RepID=A0A2A6CSI5_PRIPA|eukprot:PDM81046.1 hypothetical protein PRIPAC_36049 [Pristionchus pacificus]
MSNVESPVKERDEESSPTDELPGESVEIGERLEKTEKERDKEREAVEGKKAGRLKTSRLKGAEQSAKGAESEDVIG